MTTKTMSERARDVAKDVEALEKALRAAQAEIKNLKAENRLLGLDPVYERKYKQLTQYIEVRDKGNSERLLGRLHRGAIPRMDRHVRNDWGSPLVFGIAYCDPNEWMTHRGLPTEPMRSLAIGKVYFTLSHYTPSLGFFSHLLTDAPLSVLARVPGFERA